MVPITNERRSIKERRVAAGHEQHDLDRRRDTTDRRLASVQDVARSFGLCPDHFEAVTHDEVMEDVAHCANCEILSRRCAELEARLAQEQEYVERYRGELEDLRRRLAGN